MATGARTATGATQRTKRDEWYRRVAASGIGVALAAALSLGGCGGDGGGDASPGTTASENVREPARRSADCPLTTAQVRAVIRQEVDQVDLAVGCRWEYERVDEATASFAHAEVTYTPLARAALATEALADLGARPVDGIGDEAYTVLPNGLLVGANNVVFQIDVDTNGDDAADLGLAKELARLVIARR